MLTIKCVLEFKDGAKASGSVSAITPEGVWPVEYRGDVHRLPDQMTSANPEKLEQFFQNLAHATGSKLQVTRKGVYDLCGK